LIAPSKLIKKTIKTVGLFFIVFLKNILLFGILFKLTFEHQFDGILY
jgi:hypothetical protein